MDWGMDELGGTQISSRDYFKEVCTVPFPLKLISNQTACLKFFKIWVRISVSCHNLTRPLTLQQDSFFLFTLTPQCKASPDLVCIIDNRVKSSKTG